MSRRGLLVAIDGPNGVGKTSIVQSTASRLEALGFGVTLTTEPSGSSLGTFVRQMEEEYRGRVYACMIAADRYYHVQTEITPALSQGQVVISARYVASSLALQALDGVNLDFVWRLNSEVPPADLTVILMASPKGLNDRLSQRESFSWFERNTTREDEVAAFERAADYLRDQGATVLVVENESHPLEHTVAIIVEKILELAGREE